MAGGLAFKAHDLRGEIGCVKRPFSSTLRYLAWHRLIRATRSFGHPYVSLALTLSRCRGREASRRLESRNRNRLRFVFRTKRPSRRTVTRRSGAYACTLTRALRPDE